jgi:transcriptional regulator with XRE-family HTH domain
VLKAQGVFSAEEVQAMVAKTGLSEESLCEKLGLGARTIYRWRCGAQRPSKSLGILLAAVAHHPELLEWVEREGWKQVESSEAQTSKRMGVEVVLKHSNLFIQTPRVSRRSQLGLTPPRGSSARLRGLPSRSTGNPVSSFFQFAGTLSHG